MPFSAFCITVSLGLTLLLTYSGSTADAQSPQATALQAQTPQLQVIEPAIGNRVLQDSLGVDAVSGRPWGKFLVFVWQYKTSAQRDLKQYQQIGLQAFHIDRGEHEFDNVQWAKRLNLPYYVDHAAGKGFLHLTERTGLGELRSDGQLQPRPQSLITQAAISDVIDELKRNLGVVSQGPAAAIALDDEVSLGHFNSPFEVDASAESLRLFQQYLERQYKTIDALNTSWLTRYQSFSQVEPLGFEQVRLRITGQPFSEWNLAAWLDWRSYMDTQFAACIAHLVEAGNGMVLDVPLGIVGGQQPSPFGGFDYRKISKSVQWIESYDIGGTNELLTSFWHTPRRRILQTYFATGDRDRDSWFLWYYWAHGNAGVIAWPDKQGKAWFEDGNIDDEIKSLAGTFREIQQPSLSLPSDLDARLIYDPVAILYSHESIQVSWATDALTHGKTWPRRTSSLDNECSSSGKNRVAWSKLLEDCGIQAKWINTDSLGMTPAGGSRLWEQGMRVLILPRTLALSDDHCRGIEQFVRDGGHVIADYWTVLFDEHGVARTRNGRLHGGLDEMFGLTRNEDAGYFDGMTVTEIDGERYNKPLLERLPTDVPQRCGCQVVERGTKRDPAASNVQGGLATYLNISPIRYYDPQVRNSASGQCIRDVITGLLADAHVYPQVVCLQNDRICPMIEVLKWEKEDKVWLIVVANPTRDATIEDTGRVDPLGQPCRITLQFAKPHFGATNVRTGQQYPAGPNLEVNFDPTTALVFEMLSH